MGMFQALGAFLGKGAKALGAIGKGGAGFMGKFGTGTGFLSTIGQGGLGMGKFGTGEGALSGLLGQGGEKLLGHWDSMEGNTMEKLLSLTGGMSAPSGQELAGNTSRLSPDQRALIGTQTSTIMPTKLNPVVNPQGSQWNYNAPQAGMKGIDSMQGLLGRYMGGGGYRR